MKININKLSSQRKLLLTLLGFGVGVNLLLIFQINYFYITQIFSTLFLLLLPGFLLLWIFYPKSRDFWEVLTYSLGLSLVLLMLLGLTINAFLPLLRINSPLSFLPILISCNTLFLLLWVYLFNRNTPFPLFLEKVSFKRSLLSYLIPCVFPILSILGAIRINSNDSNTLTMYMLGFIALFVLLLTILRDKINEKIFPLSALMIGLSLLLMTSLRGWYITGHDIYLEYYVFQLTKLHHIWNMSAFPNPYTACLSITILPTIIATITHIPDLSVFKVINQIIFAFFPVITYLFLKKFINPFLAFLGTFIIMSLPTFMVDMPMLNRQEIALLFFALLLNTLFTQGFSLKIKWTLFLLFGLGLTFSHYSTTYITLTLFLITSISYFIMTFVHKHPKIKNIITIIDNKLGIEHDKANLHFGMIALLLAVTVTWNFGITNTSNGIVETINNIKKDLIKKDISQEKNDPASYSLINKKKPDDSKLLKQYVDDFTKFVRKFNDNSAFLDETIYSKYALSSGSQIKQPLTPLGTNLTNYKIDVFSFNNSIKDIYAKIMQLFIVIGFLAIFWYKKYIKRFKKEHLLITVVFFGILVGETVLPGSSISYGILRLLQQGLLLLVIPLIIGALSLFSIFDKIHRGIKIYLLSLTFIFFFLFLSGFIPQATGGYYGQLNLANSGFYYEAYYTHKDEITSINWLLKNYNKKIPIQSDWFTGNKFHTYGNVYSVDGIIPSTIRINSYVYLSHSNMATGQVMVYVQGAPIYYHFPIDILNQNKNLIYNNGGTRIYR